MANPTPDQIKATRKHAALTQTQAASLVHTTCRVWQQWEAGDRRMHPAMWNLFMLKIAVSKEGELYHWGAEYVTASWARYAVALYCTAEQMAEHTKNLNLKNVGRLLAVIDSPEADELARKAAGHNGRLQ